MPIRMVDDPNQEDQNNESKRNRPSSGGGGNPLIYFIPKILGAIFKYPKLAIPALLIGGVFFFFKGGCNLENLAGDNTNNSSIFATGAEMKQEVYDKAEVFENLYPDNTKNPLPESVSLLAYCPTRENQGQQGSCVAWSSAYAARTILEARATGNNPDEVRFSPSYLYNQIKMEGCQGSYIQRAMETMQKNGALPYTEFPYNDDDCSKIPNSEEVDKARHFNIRGAQRLSLDAENYKVNMLAIKQNLAQGSPVVIGMKVGGTFMQEMMGKEVWLPSESDYSMEGFGGHAICVIGYDDTKAGGAFQIMNSWGRDWGQNGVAWVKYNDFDYFVVEAYGLYPMGNAKVQSETRFKVNFGIAEMDERSAIKGYIPLTLKNENVFETSIPLIKNKTGFKLEVSNSVECYTYVFGQETDGSSYVLFPYTPKHSPYCGITGTRLFPKDKIMQPDGIGNKDIFAIVVTKKPIDYKALNSRISSSRKTNFNTKIKDALGDECIQNVTFNSGETFGFETEVQGKENAVVMVIEVQKK